MDIPEYKCGVLKEENKNHKLSDSYLISMDSGFDSIYNGCNPLLEKSFSRESFDIFSPNSSNRTPTKKCPLALKYHESTPKSIASYKRHIHSSSYISSHKRYKFENNENDPKNIVKKNFSYKYDHLNDSAGPFKDSPGSDFTPQQNILSSTTKHQELSFINDSALSISKHSTRCEDYFERVTLPERPSKCQRKLAPLVKNSRRKLDIPAVDNKEPGRKLYFNGTRFLNIIGKLEQYNLTLDEIFKRLSSKDLLNVSLVSKQWNSIVKSNKNANLRIQQYLNESQNIKENIKESTKSIVSHKKPQPFAQFNHITTSKTSHEESVSLRSSFFENQNVVQHLFSNERLVKCPRCSRGSIITNSLARLHSTSCISVPTSDLTFSNQKSVSICDAKAHESIINKELPQTAGDYGFCTSVACKFIFCPKCLCDYHPGENCKVSGPESPSKLIVCHKKLKTEKKLPPKSNSKRQSLRRLCFS